MTTEQVKVYRDYARFVKRLVLLAGIWPRTKEESCYFYRQLPILAVSSSAIMFLGVLQYCRENIENLGLLTKGLSLVGSFSLISLKVDRCYYIIERWRSFGCSRESARKLFE